MINNNAAKMFFKYYFKLLLLFFLCSSFWPEVFALYLKYNLNHEQLCPSNQLYRFKHLFKKPEPLKLTKSSALLIEHEWLTSDSVSTFRDCTFRVESRHYSGLSLVINKMNFRKNSITGECYDYFRFQYSNDTKSEPICGYIDKDSLRSFVDYGGLVKIYIILDYFRPVSNINIGISMTITGFNDCNTSPKSQFVCQDNMCIADDLVNDEFVNCPGPYYRDEKNLKYYNEIPVADNRSSKKGLFLSVAATLFVIVVVFSILLCLFCKYCTCRRRLCRRSHHNSRRSPRGPRPTPQPQDTETELSNVRSTTTVPVVATVVGPEIPAPSVTSVPSVPSAPSGDDKPPAYESLFPGDSR